MILEYLAPGYDDRGIYCETLAYGTLVDVHLYGKRERVVYQFPGGGQVEAVVHLASGRVIAHIDDSCGWGIQERAQTALNRRLRDITPDRFAAVHAAATVLNRSAKQVGWMK